MKKNTHHKLISSYKKLCLSILSFQLSIDPRQIKELSTLALAALEKNIILLGPPGVGKIYLLVELPIEALRRGMTVYYGTLSNLIADMKKTIMTNKQELRLKIYFRHDILVIDEVKYMQLVRQAAEILFRGHSTTGEGYLGFRGILDSSGLLY